MCTAVCGGRPGQGRQGACRSPFVSRAAPCRSAACADARLAQLSYDSFLKLFNLKSDHYTQSLCKVFDSDNSGQIGFRECAPRARCTAPPRS